MNELLKVGGAAIALITAALVGGTLIGSVLAAPAGSSSPTTNLNLGDEETGDAQAYCEAFLDAFASELGVSTDELAPAAKAAAIAAINAAVEAGDLTQDVADRMIENVTAWDGEGCRWIGFKLGQWAHHAGRVEVLSGMWEAAAEALGLTPAELREALGDATLQEVADDQGVELADVTAAALASAKADLDAAVEAGTITQERADAIYERVETWLNQGNLGDWGGHHPFGPFGPPSSDDSSDDAEGTSS
jgi:hypothetical protein